ncbi:MAG: RsmE family RNA methyltransferase [Spirochaetota bacterium]
MNIILFERPPKDGIIPRSDPRAQHIVKVLRARAGDEILLGLINGPYGLARILSIDEQAVTVSWEPSSESPPLFPLELLVAQIRPICMKRILREATSLGVQTIHVTGAQTAEKSYAQAHLWTKGEYMEYVLQGAQQAVTTRLPSVRLYPTVENALGKIEGTGIVLDPESAERRLSELSLEGAQGPAILAVGPERGWSSREKTLFSSHGYISVGMGKRILRTETACSVGLGMVLHIMGLL